MKDKPNEWISISDLMAGVMAVVMLLLVMSVLQKTYAELKHKQEMEQGGAAQQKRIAEMLNDLKKSVEEQGASSLISFDIADGRITLKDNIFEKGSACITPLAAQAFKNIDVKISKFLQENSLASIYVEGHTDSLPVSRPVTDYVRFCTVYDDNFTLSAARAREARKLLISQLNDIQSKRIVVAGFGDSHPLKGIDSKDGRNRRVEIQFTITSGVDS
ncbi:OmpA family protein [Acinetobacter gyllenbergii]|uniref:OmpA/MotB family protein n=1 Tax=Acinetobacter gyllenbergii TaxID=134534 RepID=UPI0021D1516C|nr:OmpA family protein [Acinetobacter gyllenbergii]MCU4581272.1 OmpA family protein [Acinetobacter gyllenbergii]